MGGDHRRAGDLYASARDSPGVSAGPTVTRRTRRRFLCSKERRRCATAESRACDAKWRRATSFTSRLVRLISPTTRPQRSSASVRVGRQARARRPGRLEGQRRGLPREGDRAVGTGLPSRRPAPPHSSSLCRWRSRAWRRISVMVILLLGGLACACSSSATASRRRPRGADQTLGTPRRGETGLLAAGQGTVHRAASFPVSTAARGGSPPRARSSASCALRRSL